MGRVVERLGTLQSLDRGSKKKQLARERCDRSTDKNTEKREEIMRINFWDQKTEKRVK